MALSNSIFSEAINNENFWEDQAAGLAELVNNNKKVSKPGKLNKKEWGGHQADGLKELLSGKKSDKNNWPKGYPSPAQIAFERQWLDKKDHGVPEEAR